MKRLFLTLACALLVSAAVHADTDGEVAARRTALDVAPELSGAHSGLAFLLLKRGDRTGAEKHLDAFLAKPPSEADAERWVRHAEETLETLRTDEAIADDLE